MHLQVAASLVAPAFLASPRLAAADLIVDPSNPLAYSTLQAALNAAQPGDRILLAVPVSATQIAISKSVTIEPLGAGRQQILLYPTGPGGFGELVITALSPGIPLTLRRLDFALYEMAGAVRGLRTSGIVPGEIRFDQVSCFHQTPSGTTIWGGGNLVNLSTTTVWFRETTLTARDLQSNNGCIDLDGTSGTNALVVNCDTLRLEDCVLRGSSANHLFYHCCFGSPPFCTGQYATGGPGGSALTATTRNSILVRCTLSDGNGGTVQTGPWLVPTNPGQAGSTVFGGQIGTLDRFAVTLEQGLPGQIGAAYTTRGVTVAFGPSAPLSITGPVTPGTYLGVTLGTSGPSAFLLGLVWGETSTVLGTYWVLPFDVLLHGGFGSTQVYPVPNIAGIVGLPVVTQAVQLFPAITLSNPSGVAIR